MRLQLERNFSYRRLLSAYGGLGLLVVLFLAALAIQFDYINTPPNDFHATRQYRSLIIARGFYMESSPAVPDQRREVASISKERQGILEPPVMEMTVAMGYRFIGGEHIWLPRLFSSIAWLVGGCFLFLVVNRIVGKHGALFATAFYLFLPFAVIASRSFQPDPLMVMLMLASVYSILTYYDRPSRGRLLLIAAIASSAIFIKPISLFVIFGVFVSLSVSKYGWWRGLAGPRSIVFGLVAVVPSLVFYAYGIVFTDTLRTQAQASFLPRLVLDPFFWRGWIANIDLVIGLAALVVAILGALLFERGMPRATIIGLWAGYVGFCLVFSYHIATHDYYHLQLVPIAALSIAPIAMLIYDRLLALWSAWYWRTAIWSFLVIAVLLSVAVTQTRLDHPETETKVALASEIGRRVDHSTETLYLSSDYAGPLEYHGEFSGYPWPLVADLEWERLAGVPVMEAEDRFEAWFADKSPEYFVVFDLGEFEQQDDLREFLYSNFPLLVQDERYLIFDLQSELRASPQLNAAYCGSRSSPSLPQSVVSRAGC